jgi:ribonuclease HI
MDNLIKTALAGGSYVAYTEGSCKRNRGPGGAAFLLRTPDGQTHEGSRRILSTTHNQAEMQAVLDALKATPENAMVQICLDSGYVIDNFEVYLLTWLGNGFQTTRGKDVLNRDFWEKIAEATETRNVTFHKVKAHTGDPDNEYVDGIAKAASKLAAKRADVVTWEDT